MYQLSFSKTYPNSARDLVWQAYTDIKNWPKWNHSIAEVEFNGDLRQGQHFILKSKKSKMTELIISSIIPEQQFAFSCLLFMKNQVTIERQFKETPEGLCVQHNITVCGWVTFLLKMSWTKSFGKKAQALFEKQTDSLIEYTKELNQLT